MCEEKLDAMTVNERLSALGLTELFEKAEKEFDYNKMMELLDKTQIGEQDAYVVIASISQKLNKDLDAMVSERFSADDIAPVNGLLAECEKKHGSRVAKCVVHASGGDADKLLEALRLADLDWRDVIMMGEYELIGKKLVRIRNFT
jgi:hypothetical protein